MSFTPLRKSQGAASLLEGSTTSTNEDRIFSSRQASSSSASSVVDDQQQSDSELPVKSAAKFTPRRPARGAAMAATLNIKSQSTPMVLTSDSNSDSGSDAESEVGAQSEAGSAIVKINSDHQDSPLVIKQKTLSQKSASASSKRPIPRPSSSKGKKRAITPPSTDSSDGGSVFEKEGSSAEESSDAYDSALEGNASDDESDDVKIVSSAARKRARDIAVTAVRKISQSSSAQKFSAALDISDDEEHAQQDVDLFPDNDVDITMEEAVAHAVKPKKKKQPIQAISSANTKGKGKAVEDSASDLTVQSEQSSSGSASDDSDEGSSDHSDGEDVPRGRSEKKGKSKGKSKKSSKYTKDGIRRSASPSEDKERKIARKIREREFKKSRGGKINHYEKTQLQLEKHHPELVGVWGNLEADVAIVEPVKAAQPAGITMNLLPFQLEGLYWMKQQEQGPWKGGMLADEMGMGKTIQTISLICSDHDASAKGSDRKMTLVVAPTVAIVQWRNEFRKFTNGFKVEVWHGGNRSSDLKKIQQNDVILTSYAVLESVFRRQTVGFMKNKVKQTEDSLLHKIKWHRIILDEAHNIKDRLCNTAKAAFQLRAKYRWCLSGTPLQNRVGELYSLIRFLGVLPFAAAFCKKCPCTSLHWSFKDRRHCNDCGHTPMQHVWFWNNEILKPIQRYGHVDAGSRAFKKLHTLLDRMMLRRTKVQRADDLSLPPRTVTVRRDYFSEEEEELYTSLYSDVKRNFETYLDAGTVLNNYGNIFTLITRMRQMACHPDLVLKSRTAKSVQGLLHANGDEEFTLHTCRICLDEAEDAIMSKCRHIYCRECIRSVVEGTGEANAPECPVCHVRLIINLDQPAIESAPNPAEKGGANQGMLDRIDPTKWRSSTKIEALVEELSNLRREDTTAKSLVFSQSTSFLDLIARRLQLSGFKVARLQGTMSPEARDRTVNYFMTNNDVTVFILSIKAGGVALNLTEANRVFICDPWWNPSVEYQAMDRVHRIGQSRPVICKRLIIENSIESRILELQKKKESMIDAALGNQDALGRLTPNDLRFLFSL